MTGEPVDLAAFLEQFEEVAGRADPGRSDAVTAQQALREVAAPAFHILQDARTLAPGFADHGTHHCLRMAKRANEVLTTVGKGEPARRLDTAVLLFAAIAWHDVANALLPENPPETFPGSDEWWNAGGEDGPRRWWKGQYARADHVRRSAQVLETLANSPPAAWQTYWKIALEGGPNPQGNYTFQVLSRICLSHGDDEDVWLIPEHLLRVAHPEAGYSVLSSPWDYRWADFEPAFHAAAALLNLCDLLDIGNSRYTLPRDPTLRATGLPDDPSERGKSFLHWLGHRIAAVEIESGCVYLEVCKDSNGLYRRGHFNTAALAWDTGPGGALMLWGQKQQLWDLLQDAGVPLSGVRTRFAAEDLEVWEEVRHQIEEGDFSSCWPASRVNDLLLDQLPPSERVYRSLWSQSVCASLWTDLKPGVCPPGTDLSLLTMLRRRGYVVEHVVELGMGLDDLLRDEGGGESRPVSNHFVVEPAIDGPGLDTQGELVGDMFLAALQTALLLTDACRSLRRVRFAITGNDVHRILAEESPDAEEAELLKNAVVLVHADRGDVEWWCELQQRWAASDIVLVFLALGPIAEGLRNVTRVPFVVSEPRLSLLARPDVTFVNTVSDSGDERAGLPAREAIPVNGRSASAVIRAKFLEAAGAPGLSELISRWLKGDDQTMGKGAAVYLALLELLDCAPEAAVAERLRQEYERIRALPDGRDLPELERVLAQLDGVSLTRPGALDPETRASGRRKVLEDIAGFCPWLYTFQRQVVFHAALRRVPFNQRVLATEWGNWGLEPWRDLILHAWSLSLDVRNERENYEAVARLCFEATASLLPGSPSQRAEFAAWVAEAQPNPGTPAGLIAFQMLYHLFRDDGDLGEWLPARGLLQHDTARLALLEAVGSAEERPSPVTEGELGLVKEAALHLAEQLQRDCTDAGMMACDVAVRYASRPDVRYAEAVGSLLGLEPYRQIAEALHAESYSVVETLLSPGRLASWRLMREEFLRLKDYKPPELRRRAPTPGQVGQRQQATSTTS